VSCAHSTTNTHKITTTIHTRQLQKYTRSTKNNYTQDNLKLATIDTIQIRILQYVQKVRSVFGEQILLDDFANRITEHVSCFFQLYVNI